MVLWRVEKWSQCPWKILVELKAAFVCIVLTGGFFIS
jgi:hypothetical protein